MGSHCRHAGIAYCTWRRARLIHFCVQAGNHIVAGDMSRGTLVDKPLESTRAAAGCAVQWHQFGLGCEEAAQTVAWIQELHAEGYRYGDMACLSRVMKKGAGVFGPLKIALTAAKIPYKMSRGKKYARGSNHLHSVGALLATLVHVAVTVTA